MSQIGSERTAKMNYDHQRRFLNPHPASRKRKERESILQIKPPPPPTAVPLPSPPSSARAAAAAANQADVDSACYNRLLAGYMAHEFLTSGTLLGQKWDPARAEAVPLSSRGSSEKEPSRKTKLSENKQSYADVARLLMKGGEEAHIAGVVNPSQLARWIQM